MFEFGNYNSSGFEFGIINKRKNRSARCPADGMRQLPSGYEPHDTPRHITFILTKLVDKKNIRTKWRGGGGRRGEDTLCTEVPCYALVLRYLLEEVTGIAWEFLLIFWMIFTKTIGGDISILVCSY